MLWLQAAYRTEALTTAWSDGRPGQALPVATTVTASQSAPSTLSTTMEMIFARLPEMTSIAGAASRAASCPKAANIDFSPGFRLLQGLLDLVENPLLALGQAHVLLRCVFAPAAMPSGSSSPLRRLGPALTAAVTNYDMPTGSRAIPP